MIGGGWRADAGAGRGHCVSPLGFRPSPFQPAPRPRWMACSRLPRRPRRWAGGGRGWLGGGWGGAGGVTTCVRRKHLPPHAHRTHQWGRGAGARAARTRALHHNHHHPVAGRRVRVRSSPTCSPWLTHCPPLPLPHLCSARGSPLLQAWAKTPLWRRAEYMHKAAAVMRENAQPIADVLVKEVAKPAADAYTEVIRSADLLSYTAEEGLRYFGEVRGVVWARGGGGRGRGFGALAACRAAAAPPAAARASCQPPPAHPPIAHPPTPRRPPTHPPTHPPARPPTHCRASC